MGFQPAGVKEFVKLDDTPDSYSGQAGKFTRVNTGETALEMSAAIAGVKVRKNTQMPIVGTRPQLNFMEGAAIGIQVADNPPDDEIDIAISARYPTRFKTLLPELANLPSTNPAAKATVQGTNFVYDVLDFDQTTEESCYWEEYLTPDYQEENIVVDIFWISTGAGDVKFGVQVLGREKGETWDSALGVERTVVQANAGVGLLNKARITTFAPVWSPQDVVLTKLARKPGGPDTLNADARVLKVIVSYTGQFAQAFYPLPEPQLLTLVADGAYHDVDLSDYMPVGATGALFHVVKDTVVNRDISIRKKGSTDDRYKTVDQFKHCWMGSGVDENREVQVKVSGPDLEVYIIAYTGTGVVWHDNAYDKSLGITDVWTDIDCTVECPNAIGIIIDVTESSGGGQFFGLRKKGSTDNHYINSALQGDGRALAILGCDASQVIQGQIANLGVDFYVIGYIYQGCVFHTNAPDHSPAVADEWVETDLSSDAPSGIMAFVEVSLTYTGTDGGMRKHGSTEDIHENIMHQWIPVALDANQHCDIYTSATNRLFTLTGYAQWAGA